MLGYDVTQRGRLVKNRQETPGKFVRKMTAIGIGIAIAVGILNASAHDFTHRVGPHYPMPYPLGVGSQFSLVGDDGQPVHCLTLYSWEDGSSIAKCHEGITLAHNPDTDTWERWHGCRVWHHMRDTGRTRSSLQACYGKSVASRSDTA